MTHALVGDDGAARCPWGDAPAIYRTYHDTEWGRPVRGVHGLYERMTLEAFQSGLSWLTILRKRNNFRAAFDGFDPVKVAGYGPDEVDRLLGDVGIVRNRAKIDAAIANARVVLDMGEAFADLLWGFAPAPGTYVRPVTTADIPATTPESVALAKELKHRGCRFVGPTTAYALMQATGMVNDHVAGCFVEVS